MKARIVSQLYFKESYNWSSLKAFTISNYYSFKIFPRFWLVKTTLIIHPKPAAVHQIWKESSPYCINDVKSGALRKFLNHWRQNDVKSAARCRLLNRWPRKPGDKVVLYLVSGKTKSEMAKLLSDNTLLDLQNSSYHTQPLSIIANYFTRWQKLVWYKNKNIYPEKSLYVQFFTIKSNLEKIKYD